ncbi:hypothetical protein Ancab_039911 [Ancistrocladus abbreviatus]
MCFTARRRDRNQRRDKQNGNGGKEQHVVGTLMDYARPTIDGNESNIARPTSVANTFEIKLAFIQMIQMLVQFCGLPCECPHVHITNFLEICNTFKYNNLRKDAI